MMLFKKISCCLPSFFLLFNAVGISAQDIPEPLYPYRLVNDFARLFSPTETEVLEQKLHAYNDSTSTQIYVVTVNDLDGYPISDYAFKIGEEWGIGQKGKNNGAVILIKPKIGNSKGQAFIASGYGLEARLNDAYLGRIVRNQMIPYFRENNYFGGVNEAIDAIIARLSGEFDADNSEEGKGGIPVVFIVISIIVFIVLFRLFSGGDRHIDDEGHHRGRGKFIFFPPYLGGNGHGGEVRGGFSGGGGGHFGGGGAGGSW